MALKVYINKRIYKNRRALDSVKYIVTANMGGDRKHVACCWSLEAAEKKRDIYLANLPAEEEFTSRTDFESWIAERSKLLNINWRNFDDINSIRVS